jgi:hypothetical protein
MKKVVSSEMVAHLWANQSQDEARNARNTLYFKGDTIYSYGGHFPIARHVETKKGKVILFTDRGYSITTSKHIAYVRHAISSDVEVLNCSYPGVYTDHSKNLNAMEADLTMALEKAARAKSNFECYWREANTAVARHTRYRELFGLKSKVKALTIPADWRDKALVKLKAQTEANKKRNQMRRAQEAAEIEQALADMNLWITGNDGALKTSPYCFPFTAIRLKDDETVETSKGAEFPLAHARKIWSVVSKIKAGVEPEYVHNGHSIHAGSFVVDSIKADGTLKAGCHTLTYGIMKEFADKMGWKEFNPNQLTCV